LIGYTLVLLKPDCLKRGLEEIILREIEALGFEVIATKRVRLTKKEVDIIWSSCKKESFYPDLIKFFTSGDSMVLLIKGENAIERLTDFVGHWDPTKAKPYTIRHRYGISPMENVIHSSATKEAFWKEAQLFFSKAELKQFLKNRR